ncbi:MAG TPA: KH domain-containing protein [Erysipelotrichaceae bacterium]|nr:KH domain-containing protein [Erysipelotrichaceae bacterium]
MTKLEQTLYDLIIPMVDDKEKVKVDERLSKNKKVIFLNVTTGDKDIARLIGRRGSMANSIRQTMMIASRLENKKVMVNFESKKGA